MEIAVNGPREDSNNKMCYDIDIAYGGKIVITYVPGNVAGWEQDSIRINKKSSENHVVQGPEIPINKIGEIFFAIHELLKQNSKKNS